MSIRLCLRCGRQEWRNEKEQEDCPCGGTLWRPQNVGGKPGNTDLDEAARLINAGRKPWQDPGH